MDSLLCGDPCVREVALRYLTDRDHAWIRSLLEEYERFEGRPRRELDQRLREPLPGSGPAMPARYVTQVLDRAFGARVEAAVPPVRARAVVFGEAARTARPAADVLAELARELSIDAADLEHALFADVPGERRVTAPGQPLCVADVALRANLAMVQRMLRRSTAVWIQADGSLRSVVRHAKLRGLICTVTPQRLRHSVLAISGPLRLFRRTVVYGRALGELVPFLGRCGPYQLDGEVVLGGEERRFVVRAGDPIAALPPPRPYDSRLEERFAREFRKAAPQYDVVREPEAIRAGDTLIFPDFALAHREDPRRRWLVEVIGFWTPEYLARKLAQLRAARIANLIVCIDQERNCGEQDLLPAAAVVRFRRRIDPADVLRAIEGLVQRGVVAGA